MKKIFPLLPLLLLACNSVTPTPINDFPPPPTVIPDFPFTAVPAGRRVITPQDLDDAETLLLIVKTQLAAGDDYGFAEHAHYPITISAAGKALSFATRDELVSQLPAILTAATRNAILEADTDGLQLLPEGVRVGDGVLWFNLFCTDAACADAEFLITQINPR